MGIAGTWTSTMKSAFGDMTGTWMFEEVNGVWGGTNTGMGSTAPWDSVVVDGNSITAEYTMNSAMGKMSGTVQGIYNPETDTIAGLSVSSMGGIEFTAVRA